MAGTSILNPNPPEFERFLYASVGEDRNGYAVTMLSALARLGLDPWNETADLVTLGCDAAQARLVKLLAQFRDVPALDHDHGRVARDLSRLLPQGSRSAGTIPAAASATEGRAGTSRALWLVLAIIVLLFQIFILGGAGSGE